MRIVTKKMTGKRQQERYSVRCRQSIAEEMACYEGGKIVSQEAKHYDPRFLPMKPDGTPVESDLPELYATYLFTIESPGGPNWGRWQSFGIYL